MEATTRVAKNQLTDCRASRVFLLFFVLNLPTSMRSVPEVRGNNIRSLVWTKTFQGAHPLTLMFRAVRDYMQKW